MLDSKMFLTSLLSPVGGELNVNFLGLFSIGSVTTQDALCVGLVSFSLRIFVEYFVDN